MPMPQEVDRVRRSSRQVVRALGFMRTSLAGTDLPASAVHALIEIDAHPAITATELADRLLLDKSSVSRLLRNLIDGGSVLAAPGGHDGRTKALSLTGHGARVVADIHAFARRQVEEALGRLTMRQRRCVAEGIELYAAALAACPKGSGHEDVLVIESGYRPGVIARITELHASYYASAVGFGQAFEAVVASGLAEFTGRLDRPSNQLWRAIRHGQTVGAVAIDGEDLGPGIAHLRWFIVDEGSRGLGVGRALLDAAVRFCDSQGIAGIVLWTFRGLDAARHLYQSHGFVLVEEHPGARWGREVMEQRFLRSRT
jgi:DNA-binding MarR family transcriptional regulator/N-acetylglutamate synthase-like GNAT family acetyltransferase